MHLYLFFFNDTATTEIYTLSLHDALPISGGRFVAFVSFATNLAAGDSNSSFVSGVFVHDRHTGTTELVSVDSGGGKPGDGPRPHPPLSAPGGRAALRSFSPQPLSPGPN